MAHELRNLIGQPRETLAIVLVGVAMSAVFFAVLFLFFKWRERRRRGAPPVKGPAARQAKRRKRR